MASGRSLRDGDRGDIGLACGDGRGHRCWRLMFWTVSMQIRKIVKRLVYGHCPGFAGRGPGFGSRGFFPMKAQIFDILCEEGIYESEILRLVQKVVTPHSWYFDVGANVGLMSIPILQMDNNVHVLSFEPSRNSYPYLQKTWAECRWKERWKTVFKA